MAGLSELERGNKKVRSPCLSLQLSHLKQCKGNEGRKEGCSPHEELHCAGTIGLGWAPQVSVGQKHADFSTSLGFCRSPDSLR